MIGSKLGLRRLHAALDALFPVSSILALVLLSGQGMASNSLPDTIDRVRPSGVAVGTGVMVVAVTALSAATVHLWRFAQSGTDALPTVLGLTAFTVPGVVLGGQLGPVVASRLAQHTLERILGVLFFLVGALMLVRVAR